MFFIRQETVLSFLAKACLLFGCGNRDPVDQVSIRNTLCAWQKSFTATHSGKESSRLASCRGSLATSKAKGSSSANFQIAPVSPRSRLLGLRSKKHPAEGTPDIDMRLNPAKR